MDNDSDGLTDCEDVEDCGDKSVCIPVEYSEDVLMTELTMMKTALLLPTSKTAMPMIGI